MKQFIANYHEYAAAEVRGRKITHFSLNMQLDHESYAVEPFEDVAPDHVFDYQWAIALLQQMTANLDEEYQKAGTEKLLAKIRPYLDGLMTLLGVFLSSS